MSYIIIDPDGFKLFGTTDRTSNALMSICRDNDSNVYFTMADEIPSMPTQLRIVVEGTLTKLRETR